VLEPGHERRAVAHDDESEREGNDEASGQAGEKGEASSARAGRDRAGGDREVQGARYGCTLLLTDSAELEAEPVVACPSHGDLERHGRLGAWKRGGQRELRTSRRAGGCDQVQPAQAQIPTDAGLSRRCPCGGEGRGERDRISLVASAFWHEFPLRV